MPSIHNFPARGRNIQTASKQEKSRKKLYGNYQMDLEYRPNYTNLPLPGTTVKDAAVSPDDPTTYVSVGEIYMLSDESEYLPLKEINQTELRKR